MSCYAFEYLVSISIIYLAKIGSVWRGSYGFSGVDQRWYWYEMVEFGITGKCASKANFGYSSWRWSSSVEGDIPDLRTKKK